MAIRVLLVDDEKEFVDTLAERLSLRGYALHVAYDGPGALKQAMEEKPDVVVLDMLMPGGLSGEETLCQLKALFPALPVILLSGHEIVGDDGSPAISQAFACLTKPLALNKLLEVLAAAVRQSSAGREGSNE